MQWWRSRGYLLGEGKHIDIEIDWTSWIFGIEFSCGQRFVSFAELSFGPLSFAYRW